MAIGKSRMLIHKIAVY